MELPDVQRQKDIREIPIHRVGISDVLLPLKIARRDEDTPLDVVASINCFVNLQQQERGTHMSRLVIGLQNMSGGFIHRDSMLAALANIKNSLAADDAFMVAKFHYFLKKQTPKSQLTGTQGYECSFIGRVSEGHNDFIIQAVVPVITVCPCSKEISEYGAHNQRAEIRVRVRVGAKAPVLWIEDLIPSIEMCGSSQVYPILKRLDEKYITECSYDNAKFVEDVLRDTVIKMREFPQVESFALRVKSFESIHPHDATAYYWDPSWNIGY